MADTSYIVVDGSELNKNLSDLEPHLAERFQALDAEGKSFVTSEETRQVFEEEAAERLLLGLPIAAERLNDAFQKGIAEFQNELSEDQFVAVIGKSLRVLAEDLKGKPIVASSFDGSTIRMLLEDEDDFAMVAEALFVKLDLDENGKLSRSELQPALLELGIELGVPTSSVKPNPETLLSDLFKKYGAEGSEEIGQAQFAKLLEDMLVDLADSLKANPVIVVQEGLDPSTFTPTPVLEQIIADESKLDEVTEGFFRGLDVNHDGKLTKEEIKPLFMLDSQGVTPLVANQMAENMINKIFPDENAEVPGEVSKSSFKAFMGTVLENYVENDNAAETC